MLHYSCGDARVTFLEGTFSFTPSCLRYSIRFRTRFHFLCARRNSLRQSFLETLQVAHVYCLAGWPLSCFFGIELYNYVWQPPNIHKSDTDFSWSPSLAHLHIYFSWTHQHTNALLHAYLLIVFTSPAAPNAENIGDCELIPNVIFHDACRAKLGLTGSSLVFIFFPSVEGHRFCRTGRDVEWNGWWQYLNANENEVGFGERLNV